MIDSGTMQHMIPNKKSLKDYTPMAKDVFVANDHAIKAIGKGRMDAMTSESKHVSFKNMLHVPDLMHTLLSVSSMNDNGVDVLFKANSKVLLSEGSDGALIAEGYRKDDLYYLSLQDHLDPNDMQAIACMITMNNVSESTSVDVTDMYSLWHRQMGHLSSKGLAKLPKVVDGIAEGEIMTNSMPLTCEACVYSHQTRLPFIESETKYELLELVHSDVCGPMHVPSLGGARYVFTFTDHKS